MVDASGANYVVFIIGGAVAGSEAASQLTGRGIRCVVIEQNRRPYGKIEDGLPRWHVKLRASEASKIDEKLDHPLVHFVPNTRIGVDLSFDELRSLAPSAIVLANGAWRDRPFPVPGIEQHRGQQFLYQNELVAWFNHYPDPDYMGPKLDLPDGGLVIGGGLASLDTMKILQLETVAEALNGRGIEVDLCELERQGIKARLEKLDLSLEELGLKGATLCYRRSAAEMPLTQGSGAGDKDPAKLRRVREKILKNCQRRYLFEFRELVSPDGLLLEAGKLGGLVFKRTEVGEGKVRAIPGSEHSFSAPLVVSSIGSIPEPIAGVPTRGELYAIADEASGEVEGLPGVFAMGNAVTGTGNITTSLKHGRKVSEAMIEKYLSGEASGYEESWAAATAEAGKKAKSVADRLAVGQSLSPEHLRKILETVRKLQSKSGYSGEYRRWVGSI